MHDIQALAETYFDDPSPAHREAIVTASIPLVRAIVRQLHVPHHPCLDFEDLQGVGLLGLIEALDRFDPTRGVRFSTFAFNRVRGAIIDYVRFIDILPRDRRRNIAEAKQAFDVLCQEHGHVPSDREVAEFLGVSVQRYTRLLRDAESRRSMSLHLPPSERHTRQLAETLPSEDALEDFEAVDRRHAFEQLQGLLQCLPERDREIIELYYFEGLTQRDIGTFYGISEARISQVLARITRKLRSALQPAALAA